MGEEQQEKKLNRKNNFKIIAVTAAITFTVLLVILRIPYLVNSWMLSSLGNNDSSIAGSWIGFWGSFLGGVIGTLAVVLTTYAIIRNQNKQHFELLAEQKTSIDEAAELNDRKTREREHKLFLININEELIESLIHLTKLIKLRNEVLRKINNIGQEISNLTQQQESLRTNQLVHNKEESMHEVIVSLIKDKKTSIFQESELLAEIEIKIAKVRILYTRLDFETLEVERVNSLISENSNSVVVIINRKEFGDSFHRMITEFDQKVTEKINEVAQNHIDNIKVLFEAYKK